MCGEREGRGSTYNWRMSRSVRPAAAANWFWRFMTSWIFICERVSLGAPGAAEAKAASPPTMAPSVLLMEGILIVFSCFSCFS